jgi:hypothetical protein
MEARLKKLERMNRVLCLGLGLALLPWLVGAANKVPELIEGTKGKFGTIEAQKILLVDDAGNQVGSLSGQETGSNLTIRDGNGKVRVFVGMSEGNPSLLFGNKDGKIVASYIEKNGGFETVR